MDKTVYIRLLEEGTAVIRPTTARDLGNDLFELNATLDYDPEDERWEFLPGSKVRVVRTVYEGKYLLLATELAE